MNFERNPLFSQTFSMGGNYFNNPMLNMLLQGYAGNYAMPRPLAGQSIHESFLLKERSRHFMELQRSGMMNNMLFQRMGISNSGVLSSASMFMSSPESAANKLLSNALGGNPVAATMQLYAGMAGAGAMGNFGSVQNITPAETMQIMSGITNNFYSRQAYGGPGGVQAGLNERSKNYALQTHTNLQREREAIQMRGGGNSRQDILKLYASKGIYLRDTDVDSSGMLTQAGQAKINNYNVAAGSGTQEEFDTKQSQTLRLIKARTDEGNIQDISEQVSKEKGKLLGAVKDDIEKSLKDKFKLADVDIKALQTTDKDGDVVLDKRKLKEKLDKLNADIVKKANATTEFEDIFNTSLNSQKGGGSYTGFNFQKSRGFKLEDFTSGFVRASELSLLGNTKNMDPARAAERFSANAGRAMSAARDIFGDLSGGELVEKISDSLGSSAQDLGDPEGASKIEQLLRGVSATSRVAGLSIKAMLSIVDSSKELLAQNPQLQYTNSAAVMKLSSNAVADAAQQRLDMTAGEFRSAGGQTGLTARNVKEGQTFAQSPLGSAASALLTAARAKGKSGDAAVTFIEDKLQKGEFTSYFLHSQQGISQIASLMGEDPRRVAAIMNNRVLAQKGFKNERTAELLQGATGRNQGALEALRFANLDPEKAKAEFARANKEEGITASDFVTRLIGQQNTEESANRLNTYSGTLETIFRSSISGKDPKAIAKEIKDQQDRETRMAERFDRIRANPLTQAINALMQGQTMQGYNTKAAAEGLAGIIAFPGNEPSQEQKTLLSDAQTKVDRTLKTLGANQGVQFKNLADADRKSVVEGLNAITNLKRSQLSKDEAAKLENFNEDDVENTLFALTRQGIYDAAGARDFIAGVNKDIASGKDVDVKLKLDAARLERLQNTIGLENVDTIRSGGARGLLNAQVESLRRDTSKKELARLSTDEKERLRSSLQEDFKQGGDTQKLFTEEYSAQRGGLDKLLQDLSDDPSKFQALQQQYKGVDFSKIREYQRKISSMESQYLSAPEKKQADPQAQLIETMKSLHAALTGNNKISEALEKFATVLQ